MESSKENVTNRIDEVQETPQNTASRMRTQYEQLVANSPLKETSKDLSHALSDPGDPHEASDTFPRNTDASADLRRSRIGTRELQNLASAKSRVSMRI